MGNDLTIRSAAANGPKEIKSTTHYGYVVHGITLDGSKFAVGELLVEGQCLVKDNVTGKYEKYADGNATPAVIIGAANATPADLAGINAGTSVKFVANGQDFVIDNAALAALTALGGTAAIVAAVKAAVNVNGTTFGDIGNAIISANKLRVALDEAGPEQSLKFVGTWGVAGDQATVEGALGMASGLSDQGTGGFPSGKSRPVILDESIKFRVDDAGNNPDLTAGQCLQHGGVWEGQLLNCTTAFKAAMPQMRFD